MLASSATGNKWLSHHSTAFVAGSMASTKTCVVLLTLCALVVVSESLPTRQLRYVALVPSGRRFPEPSGGLQRASRAVSSEDYQDNTAASTAGGADMEAAATLVFRPLFVYRPRGGR